MAECLGLFDERQPVDVDYTNLTLSTFDWASWIETQTRTRTIFIIFCLDMAACSFLGKPSNVPPMSFHVVMPCYEACWDARTAGECLNELQRLPSQARYSSALRLIRGARAQEPVVLEVSPFGMSALVRGLHNIIFHITQDDTLSTFPVRSPQAVTSSQDLNSIISLADSAAEMHGSESIKHVNGSLNVWRHIWDQRKFREPQFENYTNVADPMPHWYLAKLYLVQHLFKDVRTDDGVFEDPRIKVGNKWWSTRGQDKVASWVKVFGEWHRDHAGSERSPRPRPTTSAQSTITEDRMTALFPPLAS
ncbi:hypothetical protein LTR67_001846 [Exophiala xenobiotica]